MPVRIRSTGQSTMYAHDEACSFGERKGDPDELYCDPPLRGGVLTIAPSYECTIGFIAKRRSDGARVALTAGHCIAHDPDRLWSSKFASNGITANIGSPGNYQLGGSTDAGIIHIDPDRLFHRTKPWVVVGRSNPSHTSVNTAYRIRGTREPKVGRFVCHTSAFKFNTGKWTDCGEITRTNVTEDFRDGAEVHHLAQVDSFGSAGGSSGGPWYGRHRAYGLHVGHADVGSVAYFTPIGRVQDALNVDIVKARLW